MRRKPKKSEIVLLGVLVATIFYVVSLDSQVKRTKARNRAARRAVQNPVQPSSSSADNRMRSPFPLMAGDLAPDWGGDPFDRRFTRSIDAGEMGGSPRAKGTPESTLHLFGVIVSDRSAAALIDGRQLARGDTIGTYVVRSISRSRVVLESTADRSKKVLRVR